MVEMVRRESCSLRALLIAIVAAAFILPAFAQIAESTPPSMPPIYAEITVYSDTNNWTVSVITVIRTAGTGELQFVDPEPVYFAAWTAEGDLLLPPKIISSFNQSGSIYCSGARYASVSSLLFAGDTFVLDKSIYWEGSKASLLTIWDSEWYTIASSVLGSSPSHVFESLPEPPVTPQPPVAEYLPVLVAVAAIVVIVAAVSVIRKRKKGKVERKNAP